MATVGRCEAVLQLQTAGPSTAWWRWLAWIGLHVAYLWLVLGQARRC
ncbi:hypothetical protein [Nonomuraea roseola]